MEIGGLPTSIKTEVGYHKVGEIFQDVLVKQKGKTSA